MSASSSSNSERNTDATSQSSDASRQSGSSSSQPAQAARNSPGPPVNFPSMLNIGRHIDGDTDEISVIVCTQRARKRHAGELPRCYTFGWRHINHFEVPPAGKPSLMPPKYGQEREVQGYWKERVIGSIEHPTWEGDQDEDAEEVNRPLNYIEKREEWKEGNYLSYGTGSASAFEKIQSMHVPLHSYEAHRRIREDLWTAERVAANMAKHHAKTLKQHMRAEEQRRKAETTVSSGAVSNASASTSTSQSSPTTQMASEQASSSASSPPAPSSSGSGGSNSTAVVKAQTVSREGKEPAQKPKLPPPQPDRRFAPENIPHLPWYRKLWNYQAPPTGWTADERYAHRSYIIPHPIRAAMENLQRSWMLVLTPTWKLTKMLKDSFTNGTQKRLYKEMWAYSTENKQYKLLVDARKMLKDKIADEQEKQKVEKEKMDAAVEQARQATSNVKQELEKLEREVANANKRKSDEDSSKRDGN